MRWVAAPDRPHVGGKGNDMSSILDGVAILLAITATFAWINHVIIRLKPRLSAAPAAACDLVEGLPAAQVIADRLHDVLLDQASALSNSQASCSGTADQLIRVPSAEKRWIFSCFGERWIYWSGRRFTAGAARSPPSACRCAPKDGFPRLSARRSAPLPECRSRRGPGPRGGCRRCAPRPCPHEPAAAG